MEDESMKISIASYAFHGLLERGMMDVFGYLEACRYRYGMKSADIWNGMFPDIGPEFLAKVKNALAERELELANLCVDGPNIWEDDPGAREKNYKLALDYLKAAEFLAARTIRIDAGVRAPNFTTEQFDWIVKRYKEYARFAHDRGFRIGPENHWGAEVDPDNMKRICEAVDHPGFGVLVHLKGKGEEKFAKYAMHSHISMEIVKGDAEKNLAVLKDAGYDGYWSVEHHSGKNEYGEVAIQVAAVRDVLLRWEKLE
jgi:sugar phosphate isomerase/epimerase